MRLILLDLPREQRLNFYPLALSRPIWELRFGMSTLGEKLVAASGTDDIAGFVPAYMAEACQERCEYPVNDNASLRESDLLLVDTRLKADVLADWVKDLAPDLTRAVFDNDGRLLVAYVAEQDLPRLISESVEGLVDSLREMPSTVIADLPGWQYTWDLVLANGPEITRDYQASGKTGVQAAIEQPLAIRGQSDDVFIAPTAEIHPMVVIDAEHGPVYIDEGVVVHPFTRIEGPCYVGPKCTLLGAKCREGNTFGPVCRVGGEVEECIIQGYSNKYHDGFLGHAFVGEWVNLGALTTNSDLKNDYSDVSVILDGRRAVDTGSRKVGAVIGDHTKTSVGTLFNTGAYVGAMAVVAATGKPLPKHICSFAWFLEGVVTKGFGRRKLYETAQTVLGRRGLEWTPAQQNMWDEVFKMTSASRNEAIKKGRRAMKSQMS